MNHQDSSGDRGLVIVGSVALDTIATPFETRKDVLGGSASYACAAASFFIPAGMVGVVGTDFPEAHMEKYRKFGIDLAGLQKDEGETFRWSGVYEPDMINRKTLSTELNVFASFTPELPAGYSRAPFLLLGNISPGLQVHVLSQAENAQFVVADTMDLWINTQRDELMDVVSKINMLTLNDSEARLMTGEHNIVKCAEQIMGYGPDYVVIKKGEHGAVLFGKNEIFLVPAYPVGEVCDPTGAGDSFAGGMMGYLAAAKATDGAAVKKALLYGSVIASFGVEKFGLDRLEMLTLSDIDRRLNELKSMIGVA
jgi:sugar/nucleoside kinase (ribokinase family)